jgi:hypothetical protein
MRVPCDPIATTGGVSPDKGATHGDGVCAGFHPIAPGHAAALEALLPDRWLAAHPEHRLEQREEESREAQVRRRRKRAARRAVVASAFRL